MTMNLRILITEYKTFYNGVGLTEGLQMVKKYGIKL
jgi:hypothetical protein